MTRRSESKIGKVDTSHFVQLTAAMEMKDSPLDSIASSDSWSSVLVNPSGPVVE